MLERRVRGTPVAGMICPNSTGIAMATTRTSTYRQIIPGYQRWPLTSMRSIDRVHCAALLLPGHVCIYKEEEPPQQAPRSIYLPPPCLGDDFAISKEYWPLTTADHLSLLCFVDSIREFICITLVDSCMHAQLVAVAGISNIYVCACEEEGEEDSSSQQHAWSYW